MGQLSNHMVYVKTCIKHIKENTMFILSSHFPCFCLNKWDFQRVGRLGENKFWDVSNFDMTHILSHRLIAICQKKNLSACTKGLFQSSPSEIQQSSLPNHECDILNNFFVQKSSFSFLRDHSINKKKVSSNKKEHLCHTC